MTEQKLEEAVKLQEKIQYFRKEKENHENAEKECWGNFSEVVNKNYFIVIANSGKEVTKVHISANSARQALNAEINTESEILKKLEKEFDEL